MSMGIRCRVLCVAATMITSCTVGPAPLATPDSREQEQMVDKEEVSSHECIEKLWLSEEYQLLAGTILYLTRNYPGLVREAVTKDFRVDRADFEKRLRSTNREVLVAQKEIDDLTRACGVR